MYNVTASDSNQLSSSISSRYTRQESDFPLTSMTDTIRVYARVSAARGNNEPSRNVIRPRKENRMNTEID